MWCSKRQTWGAGTGKVFDIPDFMHVQGVYTTRMETLAYNSVEDYVQRLSKISNSKFGSTAFSEQKSKYKVA
jgi:hypothetical protein